MSTKNRWPDFHTTAEVEIDPSDLEDAGRVYVGDDGPEEIDERVVIQAVETWHNDTHLGVFRFCDERPCFDVRESLRTV